MRILGGLVLICIYQQLQVDSKIIDVDTRLTDEEVDHNDEDSSFAQYDNSLNELTLPGNLLTRTGAKSSNHYGLHDYNVSKLQEKSRSLDELWHGLMTLLKCGAYAVGLKTGHIEDTYFTLYNRKNPDGREIRNWTEVSEYFDKSKKTKFITHGWTSNGQLPDCTEIRDAYLEKHDYNVFVYDWNDVAGSCLYFKDVVGRLEEVAEHYAKFLTYLVDYVGANPKDIHLIGHSLGAHLSGFAGRRMKKGKKIGRITGLDPAGPGFDGDDSGWFLKSSDAAFVDVIHTGFQWCGLGTQRSAAHADFFPYGNSDQLDCVANPICNHQRSFQLFAKSIRKENKYIASKCSGHPTWEYWIPFGTSFFGVKNCHGHKAPMGESTPAKTRGIYFLRARL